MQFINGDTIALPAGKVDVVMINNTDSVYTTGAYYRIERFEDKNGLKYQGSTVLLRILDMLLNPMEGNELLQLIYKM